MDGNIFVQLDKRADNLLRYDPETITVPANSTLEVPGVASFVEILTATNDNAQISFNGSFFFPLPAGLIWSAPEGLAIRRLYIKNTSGAPVTYTIAKGIGQFTDNRLVVSSTSTINVNPLPTAFSGLYNYSASAGAAATGLTNVVAAGANLNGLLVTSAMLTARADPTADYRIYMGGTILLRVFDSQCMTLPTPIQIPAGSALQIEAIGGGAIGLSYRLL